MCQALYAPHPFDPMSLHSFLDTQGSVLFIRSVIDRLMTRPPETGKGSENQLDCIQFYCSVSRGIGTEYIRSKHAMVKCDAL